MLVGDGIQKDHASWDFHGKQLVDHFHDHISNSIMSYTEGHRIICYLSDYFCRNGSICYDLGASTGELLRELAAYHKGKKIQWRGLDIVPEMVEKASEQSKEFANVKFEEADLLTYSFEQTDLFTSYYTLQFINPSQRQSIVNKVYNSLNYGGAFIMFEKVQEQSGLFQDISNMVYSEFKISKGFSYEEVMAKSLAIKGVLVPNTSLENVDLLKKAGFKKIYKFFKSMCFEGILAIK
ncbi:MAG: methyltransferase domain-containing protein [Eubacterium sp.]|nr:methyltransferase domain-containing protein [Eubacterium sp.]